MHTIILATLTLLAPSQAQSAPQLDFGTFDATLERIQASEAETEWKSIGWRPSLASAIVEAQSADKPILLWAMNGHPLGCV